MQHPLSSTAISEIRRALIALAAVVESFSFYVLTKARFEGQGLVAEFFRFNTRSDIISNLLYIFTLVLLLRTFFKPENISLRRAIVLVAISIVIIAITFEARDFEAGEFPRLASIIYLFARAVFMAILIPRREYDLAHLAGIMQVLKNTAFVLLTAIVFTFIFSFTYTVSTDYAELKRFDADAAVILGAAVWHGNELGERPSPTFTERIKIGEDLMKHDVVQKLVVTGAAAPGEHPEGEVGQSELIKRGIEENRITIESKSHSTLEQVLYLRDELMKKQSWSKFIIVSDQYHLARVIEMCKFNGIDAIGTPSNIKQSFLTLGYYRLRESIALLAYWILGK
jgi:vancomycin permeability regulator SanA